MKYFESKMFKGTRLPWFMTSEQRDSDDYFERLEDIVCRIDNVELTFSSDLYLGSFSSGYEYALSRIRELRKYLHDEPEPFGNDYLLESLDEINEDLLGLEMDAHRFEHYFGDYGDDYDDYDDDDDDDDDEDDDDDDDEDDYGEWDDNGDDDDEWKDDEDW